jgi:DNA (cytosine-5)-methyltransferase 1
LARRTNANVSSFWPTPSASVVNDGEPVEKWEARRASLEAKHSNGNGAGTPRTIAARNWPTPTARDVKGSDLPRRNGSPSLPELVQNWPTPRASDTNGVGRHGTGGLDLRTVVGDWPPDGEDSGLSRLRRMISRHGHMCSPECLRLNPQFVNWLQGFPPGWTDCESTATQWFPSWLHMHSERLRAVWESQRILG